MKKYIVGSKMLKLDNCRDTDYLCIREENEDAQVNSRTVKFENHTINSFIKAKNVKPDPYKAKILYQMTKGFHEEEDWLFDFDIRNYREQWVAYLKAYLNDPSVEKRYTENGEILPKDFYHFAYQYYMLTENTLFLDGESKAEVQKIHDLEMPSSYFYELRDKINAL